MNDRHRAKFFWPGNGNYPYYEGKYAKTGGPSIGSGMGKWPDFGPMAQKKGLRFLVNP